MLPKIILALVFCVVSARAEAYVSGFGVLPEGRTEFAVVLHVFCHDFNRCDQSRQTEWREILQRAMREWNNAGTNFMFVGREPRSSESPCNNVSTGEVAIILANPATLCSGDHALSRWSTSGFTIPSRRRIYLNTDDGYASWPESAYRIVLHELGHVVGLGHPDEAGQAVEAIMNSRVAYDTLQPDDMAGIQFLYGTQGRPAREAGIPTLENPSPHSFQSGVGVISGWVCEATRVRVIITATDNYQDVRLDTYAAYGTIRRDTEPVCGDWDNGFSLLWNWNNLGDGDYSVSVYVDGHHARGTTVTTLGEEFLRGAEGTYVLEDFPYPGESVVVEWEQSLQNFVITDFR